MMEGYDGWTIKGHWNARPTIEWVSRTRTGAIKKFVGCDGDYLKRWRWWKRNHNVRAVKVVVDFVND